MEGRKVFEFLILLCQAYSRLSEENGERVIHPSKLGVGEPAPTSGVVPLEEGEGRAEATGPERSAGSRPRHPAPHNHTVPGSQPQP